MKVTEREHCTIISTICPYEHSCDVCRLRNDYDAAMEKALKLEESMEDCGT